MVRRGRLSIGGPGLQRGRLRPKHIHRPRSPSSLRPPTPRLGRQHRRWTDRTGSALRRGQPCASAWLEALPAARSLTLSDSEFRAALRRRLGLPILPRGAPSVTCFCCKPLTATDSEHDHTCPTTNALRVLRHDELVEVVSREMRPGGGHVRRPPGLGMVPLGCHRLKGH
jgi:hypothetical protein